MNRTLLSLTLSQNDITDAGAKELAQTLKCFPLTHEEIVERRKLRSEKGGGSESGKSPPPSRRADSKDRPGSHRSNSHLGKDKRDKSSKKKVSIQSCSLFQLWYTCRWGRLVSDFLDIRMRKLILKLRQRVVKLLKRLRKRLLTRKRLRKEAKVGQLYIL